MYFHLRKAEKPEKQIQCSGSRYLYTDPMFRQRAIYVEKDPAGVQGLYSC